MIYGAQFKGARIPERLRSRFRPYWSVCRCGNGQVHLAGKGCHPSHPPKNDRAILAGIATSLAEATTMRENMNDGNRKALLVPRRIKSTVAQLNPAKSSPRTILIYGVYLYHYPRGTRAPALY